MKKLFLVLLISTISILEGLAMTSPALVADSGKYDNDAVLHVYIEAMTDSKDVYLVFENKSNEVVTLFSQFKNFGANQPTAPGFRMWYYIDGADAVAINPHSQETHTIDEGKIILSPLEKRSFKIDLSKEKGLCNKLGLEFELKYRYIIKGYEDLHTKFIKTSYVEVF